MSFLIASLFVGLRKTDLCLQNTCVCTTISSYFFSYTSPLSNYLFHIFVNAVVNESEKGSWTLLSGSSVFGWFTVALILFVFYLEISLRGWSTFSINSEFVQNDGWCPSLFSLAFFTGCASSGGDHYLVSLAAVSFDVTLPQKKFVWGKRCVTSQKTASKKTNHDQKFPWFPAIKTSKLFQWENCSNGKIERFKPTRLCDARILLCELVAKRYKEHVVI